MSQEPALPPTDRQAEGPGQAQSPATGKMAQVKGDPTKFWHKYSDLNFEKIVWLVERILPAQSLICFYGQRGHGKTFLALDWACSIATNTIWSEKAVTPGTVAYVLAERPDGLKRRILGWFKHHGFDNEKGLLLLEPKDGESRFYVGQQRFSLDIEKECDGLIERLQQIPNLALLVLDPLVYFMSGAENETRPMQLFVEGCRRISEACQCSVLVIHHEGKGSQGRGAFNIHLGARGSSALEAGMDTVIHIGKVTGDVFKMEMTKQREAKEHGPMFFEFTPQFDDQKQDLGKFPREVSFDQKAHRAARKQEKVAAKQTEGKKTGPTQRRELIFEAIRELTEKNQPATKDAIYALKPTTKKSDGTFSGDVNALKNAGKIEEFSVKGKKSGQFHYLPTKNDVATSPEVTEPARSPAQPPSSPASPDHEAAEHVDLIGFSDDSGTS